MRRDTRSTNEELLIPLTERGATGPTVVPEETPDDAVVPRDGPLSDGFGRELKNLRVSVTDRCNFRCHYCMP